MQIKHLKTFIAVADTLSFTRAAAQVHLAQSSVSEQIQALETDLETTLFERGKRGLALTPAGCALVGPARTVLASIDEARAAVAQANDGMGGRLRIGGLETLCATRIPDLIARFHRLYPAVRVSLVSATSGDLRRRLEQRDLDLAFIYGDVAPSSALRATVMAREPLVVAVQAGQEHATVSGLPFLVTEPGCVYRRMFDEALGPLGARIGGEYGSLKAAVALVEAGMGAALLPASVITGNSKVAALTEPSVAGDVAISVVWRHQRTCPPAVAAFLALLNEPVAAIDVQKRAGREAVVHEKVDGVGDIVRRSHPAGRETTRHGV